MTVVVAELRESVAATVAKLEVVPGGLAENRVFDEAEEAVKAAASSLEARASESPEVAVVQAPNERSHASSRSATPPRRRLSDALGTRYSAAHAPVGSPGAPRDTAGA